LNTVDTIGHGCAFLDYDGDGKLDILLVGNDHLLLYRNLGNGKFEDVTDRAFPDAPRRPTLLGCAVADYDGDGYSYSANLLTQAGFTPGATVTVNGATYTWPDVQPGVYDNIQVNGQTITTPNAASGAAQLSFLGSATNGDTQGTVTITYTDGSTQSAQFGFSDWTLNAGGEPIAFNNTVAAKLADRNSGGSPDTTETYLFTTAPISLDKSKTVASITLSSSTNQGALHVFAFSIA
jgi:hypothetical protein